MVKSCYRLSWKHFILFFQVFHLTALNARGPVTSCEVFIISLKRVMICEDEVRSALLCVQDLVRSPHFTQINFFSDSGIAMLAESAAVCDSIISRAVFEPWTHVDTASCSQVVAEVCACVNQAVHRRKAVKGLQEQWYAVCSVRPSSDNSASRSGVRISNILEEGRVEYVPVSDPSIGTPGPSNGRISSGKFKKRNISRSPVKRRFENASPPQSSQEHRVVEDLGVSAALDRQQSCRKSRRSGQKWRAAPVFQGGLP